MQASCDFLRKQPLRLSEGLAFPMAEELVLTIPGTAAPEHAPLWTPRVTLLLGCGIAVLTAFGCLGIYREIANLWSEWTSDPLRSIGMLIPAASVILILRVWRQYGWEMRGTWWGLAVIGLAFFLSLLRQYALFLAVAGEAVVSLIPVSLPVYVYGSGIVLLFAGKRIWRCVWFPLGLLLLSQPVPGLTNGLIDIPLQNVSARVARSFATLIGFTPTTPELRLMFAPNFGMFIAPGCDGIRGAVTMGYVALIFGYLKRVSLFRWMTLTVGAVLLGYLFNFIRLCILVIYYRIVLGHPSMEGFAKQADYLIGSCLFLLVTVVFVRLARAMPRKPAPAEIALRSEPTSPQILNIAIKYAGFAVVILASLSLPSSALRASRQVVVEPTSFAARMPKQVGDFGLNRTWYEQQSGIPVVEGAAYSAPGSDEITLAIWVAPNLHVHDANQCWLARGLRPDILSTRPFVTAGGESIALSTGFYNDGVADSIVVNGFCTPTSCSQSQQLSSGKMLGFIFLKPHMDEFAGSVSHPVSIMVRIDRLHSGAPNAVTYGQLTDEAQKFISGLDPKNLSRAFQ
jgi:exosortase J